MAERVFCFHRHQPEGGQRLQGFTGGTCAQYRFTSSPDQLVNLRIKFNFADATEAEFDVMPFDLQGFILAAIHLPLNRVNIIDRSKIEVTSPHEGSNAFEETLSRFQVASDGAGFDHGGALPILANAFVIIIRGIRGNDRRRRGGVGA